MNASDWTLTALLSVVEVTRLVLEHDPDDRAARRALRLYGAELDRRGMPQRAGGAT